MFALHVYVVMRDTQKVSNTISRFEVGYGYNKHLLNCTDMSVFVQSPKLCAMTLTTRCAVRLQICTLPRVGRTVHLYILTVYE